MGSPRFVTFIAVVGRPPSVCSVYSVVNSLPWPDAAPASHSHLAFGALPFDFLFG